MGVGNIPDRGTARANLGDGRKQGTLKDCKTSAAGIQRRGEERRGGQRPERSYGEVGSGSFERSFIVSL